MKFKAKPIEIEAWRWDCGEPIPDWVLEASDEDILRFENSEHKSGTIYMGDNIYDFDEKDWLYVESVEVLFMYGGEFKEKYERV